MMTVRVRARITVKASVRYKYGGDVRGIRLTIKG